MTSINIKPAQVGVVGLGKMGIMHACLLNVLPNVKVAALCDKSRLMRTIASRTFHKALVTGELEKLSRLNLDAIFILTPIPSHYPIVKTIFDSNLARSVFVEKTLSSSFAKSNELCKLSQNHEGINMVGYMKRFAVTFNQAKKLLDQQILGDLVSFYGYAFSSDFADAEKSTVSRGRGGVLEDLGSHVIDLATWLLGDLDVTTAEANLKIALGYEDAVNFSVTGSNNLTGNFEVSWCKNGYRMPEFGLSIQGTHGSLSVNDDEVNLSLDNDAPKRWYRQDLSDFVGFFLGGSEYYREDKHFIDSLIYGKSTKSDFNSALKVDYLIQQVRSKIEHD